jgi:phospholipid/cholesterol/gamma-HCH transport system substrate-binding protein
VQSSQLAWNAEPPVRLGGLQVGRVTKISFAPDLGDKRIMVTMEVATQFRDRIRRDSVARVTGRGVLGDKAVDISLGSPEAESIPNGGEIATGTSGDISSLLKATGEIIDNAVGITRDLKSGVAAYTAPEVRNDVAVMMRSARSIIEEIEGGKGLAHQLIYDKKTADDVRTLLASASASAAKLDSAIGQAEGILKDIRTGDGTAHALIYDQKVAKAINNLGTAADEVAQIIHDAKSSKDGAVYQLIYGDAKTMLGDLSVAARDIRELTTKIKAGEGSLGGVINDPTVYEDLKEVLGNVKRNRILRELVRLSISTGENLDKMGKTEAPPPPKK